MRKCQRGNTSSRAKADIYDSAKFSIQRNQEWHEPRANLEFIFEKHVGSEIETVYYIFEAFTQLGWALILTLLTHCYPELVYEFYANIINKASHSEELVDSWGRGMQIYLTRDLLARVLGCNIGPVIDLKKGFVAPNKR